MVFLYEKESQISEDWFLLVPKLKSTSHEFPVRIQEKAHVDFIFIILTIFKVHFKANFMNLVPGIFKLVYSRFGYFDFR